MHATERVMLFRFRRASVPRGITWRSTISSWSQAGLSFKDNPVNYLGPTIVRLREFYARSCFFFTFNIFATWERLFSQDLALYFHLIQRHQTWNSCLLNHLTVNYVLWRMITGKTIDKEKLGVLIHIIRELFRISERSGISEILQVNILHSHSLNQCLHGPPDRSQFQNRSKTG